MTTAEDTKSLSTPSRELVEHATRELGWEERLVIYEMSATAGTSSLNVYNFPKLVSSLFGTRWDLLLVDGSKEALVWVDLNDLIAWLRDVVGDVEFADAIAQAVATEDGFKDQLDSVLPIFRERVAQYRAVIDEIEQESA